MEYKEAKQLAEEWAQMTHMVLDLKEIPIADLQVLLKETYATLFAFCKDKLVPKEISKVFLEMEDFLYFAFLTDEKEVNGDYYRYCKVNNVVKTLEAGFFRGDYGCDFPKLQMTDKSNTPFVFDFEMHLLDEISV